MGVESFGANVGGDGGESPDLGGLHTAQHFGHRLVVEVRLKRVEARSERVVDKCVAIELELTFVCFENPTKHRYLSLS